MNTSNIILKTINDAIIVIVNPNICHQNSETSVMTVRIVSDLPASFNNPEFLKLSGILAHAASPPVPIIPPLVIKVLYLSDNCGQRIIRYMVVGTINTNIPIERIK